MIYSKTPDCSAIHYSKLPGPILPLLHWKSNEQHLEARVKGFYCVKSDAQSSHTMKSKHLLGVSSKDLISLSRIKSADGRICLRAVQSYFSYPHTTPIFHSPLSTNHNQVSFSLDQSELSNPANEGHLPPHVALFQYEYSLSPICGGY